MLYNVLLMKNIPKIQAILIIPSLLFRVNFHQDIARQNELVKVKYKEEMRMKLEEERKVRQRKRRQTSSKVMASKRMRSEDDSSSVSDIHSDYSNAQLSTVSDIDSVANS